MDKVHYCERFLELLVDLEVGNIQENVLSNLQLLCSRNSHFGNISAF